MSVSLSRTDSLVNIYSRKAAMAHPDEKVIDAVHVQVLSYF